MKSAQQKRDEAVARAEFALTNSATFNSKVTSLAEANAGKEPDDVVKAVAVHLGFKLQEFSAWPERMAALRDAVLARVASNRTKKKAEPKAETQAEPKAEPTPEDHEPQASLKAGGKKAGKKGKAKAKSFEMEEHE